MDDPPTENISHWANGLSKGIKKMSDEIETLRAENERLRDERDAWRAKCEYNEANVERLRKDAWRWRESQELGFVPWDTIIEAIGDWGGPEHQCFNKAIRFISQAMKDG